MRFRLLSTIALLTLSLVSCKGPDFIPKTGGGQDTTSPGSESIGKVSNIRTRVYVGEPSNLQLIDGETDLGNDEYVKVQDGGKARLTFPGPINMLLYNQTEMDEVRLEFDDKSNPRIVNRLIRGGFSGYVEPGSYLTINLSSGVKVNVLGTNFFVIFDDKTGNLTIGKFDGTLFVSIPNIGNITVRDGEMIDIPAQGKLKRHFAFRFNLAQFDAAMDQCLSPVQGFNLLRNSNSIPLPGEETFEAKTDLPCDPLIPLTVTATLACEMPVAIVQSKVVILRDGPDIRYFKVGQHIKNEEFAIEGRYRDWYQGQFPNGDKGWLYKDWLSIPSDVDAQNICEINHTGSPPTPAPRERCYTLFCP